MCKAKFQSQEMALGKRKKYSQGPSGVEAKISDHTDASVVSGHLKRGSIVLCVCGCDITLGSVVMYQCVGLISHSGQKMTFDKMSVEPWPIIQAFALEEVGGCVCNVR